VTNCDRLWAKTSAGLGVARLMASHAGNRGVAIGRRTNATARTLWHSIPAVYRQCGVCYTDFWEADAAVLPSKRHRPVGKESGQTNHIERFNNTFRQRCRRLVRKTLSFSKKLINHLGAIWYFIHDYNARQRATLTSTTSA
jgi:insertion element IS1 protein InsB